MTKNLLFPLTLSLAACAPTDALPTDTFLGFLAGAVISGIASRRATARREAQLSAALEEAYAQTEFLEQELEIAVGVGERLKESLTARYAHTYGYAPVFRQPETGFPHMERETDLVRDHDNPNRFLFMPRDTGRQP